MSSLSAALVHGPVCAARVVAATRLGAYLLVEKEDVEEQDVEEQDHATQTVLPVLLPAALTLPTAVRLSNDNLAPILPSLRLGDVVQVGAGIVDLGAAQVRIVRTFRPARVRPVPGGAITGFGPERGGTEWDWTEQDLVGRIGLGPGLTPEADDELAGQLLVTAALGRPAPDLEPHLHRTTALSASLLRAAAQGYAVPTVVAYVDAALTGDTDAVERLRPQVQAIGHTSGPALLRGIDRAVELTSHAIVPTTSIVPNTRRVA